MYGIAPGHRVTYLAPPVDPSALWVMQTENRRPIATEDNQRHE